MNLPTIALIMLLTTLTFYLSFLLLGVVGISKNRKAQGLDQKSKNQVLCSKLFLSLYYKILK